MKNFFVTLLDAMGEVFFPSRCGLCSSYSASVLCQNCFRQIRWVFPPFCSRCGKIQKYIDESCLVCQTVEGVLDQIRSAAFYEGVLAQMVKQFKYHKRLSWAPFLAMFITLGFRSKRLGMAHELIDTLVPIPPRLGTFGKWKIDDGVGHMSYLSHIVSHQLSVPSLLCLERTQFTFPQYGLSRSLRLKNQEGSFGVKMPERVKGKTILLLDDMLTTGSTLKSAALALRKAGAFRVLALTLCQGVTKNSNVL